MSRFFSPFKSGGFSHPDWQLPLKDRDRSWRPWHYDWRMSKRDDACAQVVADCFTYLVGEGLVCA